MTFLINMPTTEKRANNTIFIATIVEPTGVPASIETNIPIAAQVTAVTTEHIVTDLKVLSTRIADIAGKTTNAEINKAPTRFIARTITIAITEARIKLYNFALTPVADAKSSSKVTAKTLL